jgi:hypothetical protein
VLLPGISSSFAFCPIYSRTSRRAQPGTGRHSKQNNASFMEKEEVELLSSIAIVDSNTDTQACKTKREDTTSQPTVKEWVLTVPPQLTQLALQILLQADCTPQPWHLEVRNGSRIHKHNTERMGIPIWSTDRVRQASHIFTALLDLLQTTDEHGQVEMVCKEYKISNRRPYEPPPHDARIHPERAPEIPAACANNKSSQHSTATSALPAFAYAEHFAGLEALESLSKRWVVNASFVPNYKTLVEICILPS